MGLSWKIRSGWGCAVLLGCVTMQSFAARPVQRRAVELTPWEQAERGREALEAIPERRRTKVDYTRAMNGFRAIYHDSPGDVHAPDSVNTVAELLVEQGRLLQDAKSLKDAVGQYEFLRVQYPGSSLRVAALLAQGQIYQNDLHDAGSAKERYALLVKDFPRSEMAEEARAGLASLNQGTGRKGQGSGRVTAAAIVPAAPVAVDGAKSRVVAGGNTSGRPGVSAKADAASGVSKAVAPASVSAPVTAAVPAQGSGGVSSFAPMPVTGQAATEWRNGGSAATAAVEKTAAVQDANAASAGPMHVAATTKRRGEMAQVTGIRHWSTPDYTRVAIDLGDDVTYEAARVPNPDRIYFDLHGTKLAHELVGKSFTVTDDGFLKRIRAAQFSDDMTRVVLDVNDVTEYSAFLLPNPYRLIIDIHGKGKAGTGAAQVAAMAPVQRPAETSASTVPNTTAVKSSSSFDVAALSAQPGKVDATSQPTSQPISAVVKEQGTGLRAQGSGKTQAADAAADGGSGAVDTASTTAKKSRRGKSVKDAGADALPARAAVPTADGETSLVRALGLKIGRIVIDPGHGGHDSGTLGADGIEEKDVVLDVALRLGKLLHERLGSQIIYTRSDDTFIPLETRTAIANKAQADLFLSIHANSSQDTSARGVETYYLNFTTSTDALETAARENAVSDQSVHQLSDLVKKIALKDKIAESREFASDVQQGLYNGLQKGNVGLKDRGVKKAPFVVLIGANMPSILAEISFVTNEKDAAQLREPEYRQRVAESLYKGVAKYTSGLSGAHPPTEQASGN